MLVVGVLCRVEEQGLGHFLGVEGAVLDCCCGVIVVVVALTEFRDGDVEAFRFVLAYEFEAEIESLF